MCLASHVTYLEYVNHPTEPVGTTAHREGREGGDGPARAADESGATPGDAAIPGHHARQAFASQGYADTSLDGITGAAGVTKGALYHQCAGKQELFRAVFEQVVEAPDDEVATAAPEADTWGRLVAGCEHFLRASTDPSVRRIMLIDAPSVLGRGHWRNQDAQASLPALEQVLTELMADGELIDQPIGPLTHLLSGAMNEAAFWLAGSADPERDLRATMTTLVRLLESQRRASDEFARIRASSWRKRIPTRGPRHAMCGHRQ